eukprot:TRINITY_DN9785_c1_g1_i1.p1 TRINITY_DN9785_c1_g1~~TRINITY_DN9785_c1_g1_i1.p1  ORF type:complete len:110 (-),score=21.18 TRINITY_DN9785_c1_g1_i1:57-386(-)
MQREKRPGDICHVEIGAQAPSMEIRQSIGAQAQLKSRDESGRARWRETREGERNGLKVQKIPSTEDLRPGERDKKGRRPGEMRSFSGRLFRGGRGRERRVSLKGKREAR